jgi:hypothetical protein
VIDGLVIKFEYITALKEPQAKLTTLNAELDKRERQRTSVSEVGDAPKTE